MIPNIRGNFEITIVTGISSGFLGMGHIVKHETTISLRFRPLRADEIKKLLWELENGIIDAWRFREKMVDLALDEKEMCEKYGRLRVFQLLDEHLSMAEKNAIYEWVETVSEFPPLPKHGDLKTFKGKLYAYDANKDEFILQYDPKKSYVQCEYCDSWVETTHINCPNCGAPVKRR